MKYFIIFLFLISCKPASLFKENPCPNFEQNYNKQKPKKTKIIEKEKTILNPKFR